MHDIDFPFEALHLNGNGKHHNVESSEQRAVRGRYQRLDVYDEAATDLIAGHVHRILETPGEAPEREGLVKTPERVAKAHVAYIPDGKIVGLSKIPRVVDVFARRLQVQERLTVQIRDAIQEVLQPQGVAVVIEATHLCMVMRGAQKQHSSTVTSAVSGTFFD